MDNLPGGKGQPDLAQPKAEKSPFYRKGAAFEEGKWLCRRCGAPVEGLLVRECAEILVDQQGNEWLCGQRFGPEVLKEDLRSRAITFLRENAGDPAVPADFGRWIQNNVLKRKRNVFKAYVELRHTLKWAELGCRTPPPVPKGLEKQRRKLVPLARAGRSRSVRGYVFVLGKLVKRKDW